MLGIWRRQLTEPRRSLLLGWQIPRTSARHDRQVRIECIRWQKPAILSAIWTGLLIRRSAWFSKGRVYIWTYGNRKSLTCVSGLTGQFLFVSRQDFRTAPYINYTFNLCSMKTIAVTNKLGCHGTRHVLFSVSSPHPQNIRDLKQRRRRRQRERHFKI